MSESDADTVHTRIDGALGVLTLNRPAALNALDPSMISAMRAALDDWTTNDRVRAVWVEGAGGKGLCAGGDVREMSRLVQGGDIEAAVQFFAHEYRLNAATRDYPKPYVAWMDGVVMGGGIGISGHASHRLVTERSVLAMPETIIGFFPDVGALWLLSRTPGELGTHLALTGSSFTGTDAVEIGIADYSVRSESKQQVYAALAIAADSAASKAATDEAALEELRLWAPPEETRMPPADSDLAAARPWIDECYAGADAHTILEKLRACERPEARAAAELIEQRSPHSVAVTLEALRRAASMSLAEVLEQDLVLARACVKHPDFVEGVRAQLVDKDRSPSWADADLAQIDREDVLAAFTTT